MTATHQGRLAGAERQLPGIYGLGRVLAFTVRLTGIVFGFVFGVGPVYLIGRFAVPSLRDPSRTFGDHVGAILFSLFLLLFVLLGAFLVRISIRPEGVPKPQSPFLLPSRQTMLELARNSRQAKTLGLQSRADGTYVLSSVALYRGSAILVAAFAFVWNTVIFLSFRDLHTFGTALKVFQILFALPFLSLGIGLVYIAFKLVKALGQPGIEFTFQKPLFAVGEKVRVGVYVNDPKRKLRKLELIVRKRHFSHGLESTPLEGEPWVFEEKVLLERAGDQIGTEWTDTLEFSVTEEMGEWAEWSIEAKADTDRVRPLYLVAKLPFDRDP